MQLTSVELRFLPIPSLTIGLIVPSLLDVLSIIFMDLHIT
jgi:hypothetical protein